VSSDENVIRQARRRAAALARRLFKPQVGDAYRRYIESQSGAWTGGYSEARAEIVHNALSSPSTMMTFRSGGALPAGYGVGIDERCVEYPHVLSRLEEGAGLVLDAGSALNHDYVLNTPAMNKRTVHIVTLAPEGYRKVSHRVSYLYGDLADLGFLASESYCAVVCISTLEHVGMDNAGFSVDRGQASAAENPLINEARAVRELWRLLRPGGRLYITVPYGLGSLPAMRVYDAPAIERLSSILSVCPVVDYYRYRAAGWARASSEECADAHYVPWIMEPDSARGSPPREPDRAAAARAVVCLEYTKKKADTV
jgi:SAM-dependent methyltransferase